MDDRLPAKIQERIIPEPNSACWIWIGDRFSGRPYGRFRRRQLAHRVVYQLLVGPIPADKELDHLCRVLPCVNPAHLEAVSHRENCLRGIAPAAQHARQTTCSRGHVFDRVMGDGRRVCTICRGTRDRARWHAGGKLRRDPARFAAYMREYQRRRRLAALSAGAA